jgi:hypothetical protein
MPAPHRAALILLLYAACDRGRPPIDPLLLVGTEHRLEPNATRLVTDGRLTPGFYFVVDSGHGFPRSSASGTRFIDPTPIVTAGNFAAVRPGAAMDGRPIVQLGLADVGTARLKVVTRKATGGTIAIVVNHAVLSAPAMMGEIGNGWVEFDPGEGTGMSVLDHVRLLSTEHGRTAPRR